MASIIETKRVTYDDYVKIDDNNRYEIFHGELRMVPAPSTDHQSISINLGSLLWEYVKEKKLGKIFEAPTDVVFNDDEVFQPDIIFIKKENLGIVRKNAIHGIPDLIVEILSPSSTFYDTAEKKEVYRKYGVREYWLVFPEEKAIEVLSLENGAYFEYCKVKKNGLVKSKTLDGLEINVTDVFDL